MIILWGASDTGVGRLLTLPPVVAIGLISYSAYLWHQPILAFLRIHLRTPDVVHLAPVVLIGSIALAALSWRFVEQPFRKKDASVKSVFIPFFVVLGLFLSGAVWIKEQRGLLWVSSEELAGIELWKEQQRPPGFGCMTDAIEHPVENCLSRPGEKPDVILWGDSHAASLFSGLKAATDQRGLNLYAAMAGGCPPVADIAAATGDYASCPQFNDRMLAYIERSGARVVVLSAHWALYSEGSRFINEAGVRDLGGEVPYDIVGADGRDGRFSRLAGAYEAHIRALTDMDLTVILVGQLPIPGWDAPYRILELKSAARLGDVEGIAQNSFLAWSGRTNKTFEGFAGEKLIVLNPAELLCVSSEVDVCAYYEAGKILFFDSNHLSLDGAARFSGSFERILESTFKEK